jgi:hypothetical protein
MLGTAAIYAVLAVDGKPVTVEVVEAPGLAPRTRLHLRCTGVVRAALRAYGFRPVVGRLTAGGRPSARCRLIKLAEMHAKRVLDVPRVDLAGLGELGGWAWPVPAEATGRT